MHIGPHKTATTYIQHRLHAAKSDLKKNALAYSDVGIEINSKHNAHHDLAHNPNKYIDKDGEHFKDLSSLAQKLHADKLQLLLSAEGFCKWPASRYLKLADIFGEDKVSVFYTIRDPFDIFFSYWSEEVKQGYTASLATRYAECAAEPMRSRIFNPLIDLNPLIGEKRIVVNAVFYDIIKEEKKDIFDVLCREWLNVPIIADKKIAAKNESFSIELTEFIRLITHLMSNGKRHIGSDFRLLFMRQTTPQFRDLITKSILEFGQTARRKLVVKRDGSLINSLEKRITTQLGKAKNINIPNPPIFRRTQTEWNYYDIFTLSQIPEVRKLVLETYNKMGVKQPYL